MFTYEVFGGTLASAFPFPELRSVPHRGTPTWTVQRREQPEILPGLSLVGEDRNSADLNLRLYRGEDRFRLDHGPLGIYDITNDGSGITWHPGEHDCENCARQLIVGRVLAVAIHLAGDLCLHSSCVSVGGESIAFVAPKGTGKSTLAAAMVGRGCTLVTDDMLRVRIGQEASIFAGVQRLRLRSDSAEMATAAGIDSEEGRDGKHVSTFAPASSSELPGLQLGAIYVLQPVNAAAGVFASRELLRGPQTVMALVSNAMVGSLLGDSTSQLIRRAVLLGADVPIYVLRVPRSYESLPEVTDRLLEWHGSTDMDFMIRGASEDRRDWKVARAG